MIKNNEEEHACENGGLHSLVQYIYTAAQYFTNGIISQLENLSYNYPNPIVEQELSRAP